MEIGAPTGFVTLLFTDIEGSTALARRLGDEWPSVLQQHHAILRSAITDAGGYIEGNEGDAFVAAFLRADDAVTAAAAAQRALEAHTWPAAGPVRVRMGIHSGGVERTDDKYVGLEIHRAARVGSAAHGGQIILSGAARAALTTDVDCDDLGTHRLKDFPEPTQLFHASIGGCRAAEFPPPRTLDVRPTNLPPTDATVIGRDPQIESVQRLLETRDSQLVTVTGPGGAGKTTVALAAARSLLDSFPAGVWLVRAEALTTAGQLVSAVAEVLWLRDVPGEDLLRRVGDRLADGRLLLVLDNLEQIDGAASVVASMIERGPASALLVTSRAPLRLSVERVVALGALEPDDAVALLANRAGVVAADLPDDPVARAALHEICDRLDRSPLAIELVAPRLRVFSPVELRDRLESVVDITSPAADRPERHRSVRSTVEWSVGLLASEPSALFRRLAVFHAPAPIGRIEQVCGRDLDATASLAELLDFSLVHRATVGFVMLAAVREVAAGLLATSGEEDEVRRAHAACMAAVADRMSSATGVSADLDSTPDQWAATEWARSAAPDLHRRLVMGLAGLWAQRGRLRHVLEEVDAALAAPDASPVDCGRLLRRRAYVLLLLGDETAEADARRAVDLLVGAGRDGDAARAYVLLSQTLAASGQLPAALEAAGAAVSIAEATDDPQLEARAFAEIAQIQAIDGDLVASDAALCRVEAIGRVARGEAASLARAMRASWAVAAGDHRLVLERNLAVIDEGQRFPEWTVAAVAVALAGLGATHEALEAGAIAAAMAAELGIPIDALTQVGEPVRVVMERAREAVGADVADACERAGRELSPGQRLLRVRELAVGQVSSPS